LNDHGKKYSASCRLLLLAGAILVAFGCQPQRVKDQAATPAPAIAREITDDLGRRVRLPEKVERAVSLAPNLTEITFAVGAGDQLAGNTTYCDFPAEAQNVPKVGDTISPNLERIIALKPEVVFVSTASQIESFAETLDKQKIAVFVTNPNDLEGVYKSIFQIGEIFGKGERARAVVDELKKRAAAVEAKTNSQGGTAPVRVFVQISDEPLFTVGKSSFLTDLIARAGGVSVTANVEEAYPKFSKETALALAPEAIILSDSTDNREPNDVFKNSPAVTNGKVFRVNADWMSRPGPRLVDALERIAQSLHPERFQ
jgi:iron complex transport system substrate-binding protein